MKNGTRPFNVLGDLLLEDKLAMLAASIDIFSVESESKNSQRLIVFNTALRKRNSVIKAEGAPIYTGNISSMSFEVTISGVTERNFLIFAAFIYTALLGIHSEKTGRGRISPSQ